MDTKTKNACALIAAEWAIDYRRAGDQLRLEFWTIIASLFTSKPLVTPDLPSFEKMVRMAIEDCDAARTVHGRMAVVGDPLGKKMASEAKALRAGLAQLQKEAA